MPQGQPINSVADESAIRAQIDRVIADVARLGTALQNVQKANENTKQQNTFIGIRDAAKEVQTQLSSLSTANNTLADSQRKATASLVENDRARKSALASGNQGIQQLAAEAEAIKKTTTVIQPLAKGLRDVALANESLSATSVSVIAPKIDPEAFTKLSAAAKQAERDLEQIAAQFGADSEQARIAAISFAEYKKQLQDIKALKSSIPPATAAVSTTNLPALIAEQETLKETGIVVSELEQAEVKATAAAIEFYNAQKASLEAGSEAAAIVETELTEYQQLAETLAVTRAELNATNIAVKNNNKAYTDGIISEEAYIAAAAQLATEQQQLKISLAATSKEFANQTRVVLGDVGAYDLLSARAVSATKKAQDLGGRFGKNSVEFKEAAATARGLNQELLAIDETLGKSQRNVGNYGSAFKKGFGLIRQAANILPGIGISGIFLLIYQGLDVLVTKLFNTVPAFNAVRESARNFVGVIQEAQKSSIQEATNLQILAKAATDTALPMAVRLGAVKDLQKEYPTYLGNLSQEAILSGQAADQIKLLSAALFQKAFAEAAANKAAALSLDNLDLQGRERFLVQEQVKATKELNAARKDANNTAIGGSTAVAGGAGTLNNRLTEAQGHYEDIGKLLDDNRKKQAFNTKEVDKYITAAEKAQGAVQSLEDPKGDAAANDRQSKLNDYLQKLLKARQQANQLALEADIKANEDIANNESKSFAVRFAAAQEASRLRIQLIKDNAAAEVKENELASAELLKSQQTEQKNLLNNKNLTSDQRSRIIAQIAEEEATAQAAAAKERLNIEKKANNDILNETVSTGNRLLQLRKTQDLEISKRPTVKPVLAGDFVAELVKPIQDAYNLRAEVIQTGANNEEIALRKSYKRGTIGYQDYQNQLRDLNLKTQKELLENTLQGLEKSYNLYKTAGLIGTEPAQKIALAISEAKKGIANLSDELPKLGSNASAALLKVQSVFETIATSVQSISDLIGQAVDNSVTKQKNALQALEDQQEKNYEAEVARVNDSTLSEQDKANTLIKLEATRAAQKEANDRKERAIERQRAVFDKAAAIARITVEGALAVIHQLTSGDPYTAIIRAVAVGALAAGQLALAISAPIPAFAKGTDNAPAGAAWVGEKGTELGIERSGKMFLTPSTPTVMNLQSGTRIIPHDEVDQVLLNMMMRNTVAKQDIVHDPMPEIAMKQLAYLKKAAKAKQPVNVKVIVIDKSYEMNKVKR